MITNFNIFEKNEINEDIKHVFIIDDIAQYYIEIYGGYAKVEFKDFLDSIMDLRNVIVAFECNNCKNYEVYDAIIHQKRCHKGIISEISYNLDYYNNKLIVHFDISLKKIKYRHEVNTAGLFFIFGEISKSFEKILDDFEIYKNTKKYNL